MSIVVDALIVGGLQLLGAIFVVSALRFLDCVFLLFSRKAGGDAVRLLGNATVYLVVWVGSSTAFQLAGSSYFG